jgi:hypothetical protein
MLLFAHLGNSALTRCISTLRRQLARKSEGGADDSDEVRFCIHNNDVNVISIIAAVACLYFL